MERKHHTFSIGALQCRLGSLIFDVMVVVVVVIMIIWPQYQSKNGNLASLEEKPLQPNSMQIVQFSKTPVI